MDKQISVERFYIFIAGDPEVGIWDQEYTIGSDFYFEDQEELTTFKKKLGEAFEYVGENPEIATQEEIDAENARMDILTEQMLEDMDNDMFDDGPKKMRDQYE